LGAPIIDASEMITVVHQNHDYSHHPQGKKGVWEGLEAKRNQELMAEDTIASLWPMPLIS